MYDGEPAFDPTELRRKGVQHLPGFFTSEAVKRDLSERAAEILAARDAGALTTNDQDAHGFDYPWYEPVVLNERLLALMKDLLGPDLCASGWRILIKDRHYREGIAVHQDWPYNTGGTEKISVFIPLTKISSRNSGLYFLEESHLYGPVSRGPLEPSFFPRMQELCPDLELGDIVVCDYLTWHYSKKSETEDERIYLQINYQPAGDPSSKNLISGVMPHDKLLTNRFDAASLPSVELNAPFARAALANGNSDRAKRFSMGLVNDDPDHASAALLAYDVLLAGDDLAAFEYLAKAKTALARLNAQLAERTHLLEAEAVEGAAGPADWAKLPAAWLSSVDGYPDRETPPLHLATPDAAWAYGAVTEALAFEGAVAIRIRGRAVKGKVAVCLVNEAQDALLSEHHLFPADGEAATLLIPFRSTGTPVRLCIRNFDDAGRMGLVEIAAVDVRRFADA